MPYKCNLPFWLVSDLLDNNDKIIMCPPFEIENNITTEPINDPEKGIYGIKVINKPKLKFFVKKHES